MLSKIKKLLFGTNDAPRAPFDSLELGLIEFNIENGFWVTKVSTDECPFAFQFDGEETPNEEHFSHAREIKANVHEFQSMIKRFLTDEAAKLSHGGEEVLSLTIESVCLWILGMVRINLMSE
jgi:hypothetical protein